MVNITEGEVTSLNLSFSFSLGLITFIYITEGDESGVFEKLSTIRDVVRKV